MTEEDQTSSWRKEALQEDGLIIVAPRPYICKKSNLKTLIDHPVEILLEAVPLLGKVSAGLALFSIAMQQDLANHHGVMEKIYASMNTIFQGTKGTPASTAGFLQWPIIENPIALQVKTSLPMPGTYIVEEQSVKQNSLPNTRRSEVKTILDGSLRRELADTPARLSAIAGGICGIRTDNTISVTVTPLPTGELSTLATHCKDEAEGVILARSNSQEGTGTGENFLQAQRREIPMMGHSPGHPPWNRRRTSSGPTGKSHRSTYTPKVKILWKKCSCWHAGAMTARSRSLNTMMFIWRSRWAFYRMGDSNVSQHGALPSARGRMKSCGNKTFRYAQVYTLQGPSSRVLPTQRIRRATLLVNLSCRGTRRFTSVGN